MQRDSYRAPELAAAATVAAAASASAQNAPRPRYIPGKVRAGAELHRDFAVALHPEKEKGEPAAPEQPDPRRPGSINKALASSPSPSPNPPCLPPPCHLPKSQAQASRANSNKFKKVRGRRAAQATRSCQLTARPVSPGSRRCGAAGCRDCGAVGLRGRRLRRRWQLRGAGAEVRAGWRPGAEAGGARRRGGARGLLAASPPVGGPSSPPGSARCSARAIDK